MATTNPQICFNNEDLINELIQNVLGDFINASVTETSDVIDTCVMETLDDIIDAIETPKDNDLQDTEIDDVVEEVVRSMMLVICDDASSGGEAPLTELQSVESTATSEGGPLGDAVQDVNEERTPAKGAEVFNRFGDLVGWLDPGATPVQSAPRRLNPFSVTWKCVKRVVRGICCCRGEGVD
ncbi:unnamed protein product [Macrosiphum euphorbiae]|uniref:Uncharacterized protein n=1 Tax=Macrosiphum euphorbiae TaxID=13131 RepID=A0AAV0X599_9HEMI|nr:unnamed protein product [Macrosiphum euphorbiae]